jgi:hypothetical protein
VGIIYRARQFWRTVFLKTDFQPCQQASEYLTPAQWALFTQLQPPEQVHALRMFYQLQDQGEISPDLLVAALLHDVGKLRYPLQPVERAAIVLVQAIFPGRARQWGALPEQAWENLPGWRRAFILAEQHAGWGADLAHQAGVSPLAEALIRRHHQPPLAGGAELEDVLLYKLWVIDNVS